ncbi:MAG: hypothetical protein EZS28_005928 [Streblomastix strix]|uniref:non-specific serine/threonine protein kinase n=1 Tax=Streblomastix strix TaxID=222440 RepID=A0A5J4WUR5_9EUKA|nr:MAG: hypothetical protein EZS28_005928 [Streblomastix strix]
MSRVEDYGIGLTDESTNKYYQIMIKSKMDQSSNVFSLGCIIHEALTGQHPFFAPTKQEMIEKIRKGQFTELPDWIEPEMKDLVLAMMNQNPDKRPTIKRIIEMKKIKSLISHFIENEQIRELTIEKLKRMKDEVQTVENDKKSSVCLITKVSEGLKTVRYIRTGNEIQINGKIYELIKEVTENCASIISRVIQSEEDVELAFQHNLIQVLIDLLRCTPLDDITPSMTKAFEIISDQGSSVQTHRLFEMSTIHSLVQIIRIKDKDILLNILKTFIHIIKNGWSQIKTSQSQYAQQQFNLQQLLQPNSHPYLVQLEKDAIIRIIIEDLLANESTYLWCKYKICEILDILYPEGAQLPSDLQPQIINQLYSPMKQKHEIEPYALQSLSYLAINYGNHGAIIAGGGVNIASEYIIFTQKEKAMKLLSAFSDPEGMRSPRHYSVQRL